MKRNYYFHRGLSQSTSHKILFIFCFYIFQYFQSLKSLLYAFLADNALKEVVDLALLNALKTFGYLRMLLSVTLLWSLVLSNLQKIRQMLSDKTRAPES